MPITTSAKKALRVADRKRIFNLRLKAEIDRTSKAVKKLVAENKVKEAQALLPKVYQALDKAAQKKYIKKNTAARKKSRIVAMVKKASNK
jgi:small subunit ribosomal protein S20